MNTQKQKTKTYYFRGQIEVVSNGQYKWVDGYSAQGNNGGTLYPWETKKQCRNDAKKEGLKAVFMESQS
jgi:hypothetical protein